LGSVTYLDDAGKRLSAGILDGDGGVRARVRSVVMDATFGSSVMVGKCTLGSFVVAGDTRGAAVGDTIGSRTVVGDTLGSGAGEAMGFGLNIEARR